MKTLPAKLTITRVRSNRDDGHVSITIHDATSGCDAVKVVISPADFAEALLGLGHVECEMEFNDSGVVGKACEVKTVEVLVPKCDFKDREAIARKAVAEHEVDGWEGRVEDATNQHCRVRQEGNGSIYRVTYIRFVEKTT